MALCRSFERYLNKMAGIAHKNLTDPQLHEPKGASTAVNGSVPFADGNGATEWRLIGIDELSFTPEAVSDAPTSQVVVPDPISTAGMSAVTDGTLADALTFTVENKNVKELAVKLNALTEAVEALRLEHVNTVTAINALIDKLKTTGFIQ